MELVEAICKIQGNKSDEVFARELGVHRVTLNRIKNAQTKAGLEFLARLVLKYPTLWPIVDTYYKQSFTKVLDNLTEVK